MIKLVGIEARLYHCVDTKRNEIKYQSAILVIEVTTKCYVFFYCFILLYFLFCTKSHEILPTIVRSFLWNNHIVFLTLFFYFDNCLVLLCAIAHSFTIKMIRNKYVKIFVRILIMFRIIFDNYNANKLR